MAEIARLNGDSDWIELDFVEKEIGTNSSPSVGTDEYTC
jgi:hypothetical protein